MTPPNPDDLRTDADPESDVPGPGGADSVQALHRPVMDVMNDPVMISADGTAATTPGLDEPADETDEAGPHDIFLREQAEPRDGFEPVPMWVPVAFAALLMWGGYYLGTYSADFRRDIDDVPDPKPVVVVPAPLPPATAPTPAK